MHVFMWVVLKRRTRYSSTGDLSVVSTSTKAERPNVPAGCVLTRIKIETDRQVIQAAEAAVVRVERNQAEIKAEVSEA